MEVIDKNDLQIIEDLENNDKNCNNLEDLEINIWLMIL